MPYTQAIYTGHIHVHTKLFKPVCKAHTFSLSIEVVATGGSCELKASLVYKAFQANQGYILRYCLKKQNNNKS